MVHKYSLQIFSPCFHIVHHTHTLFVYASCLDCLLPHRSQRAIQVPPADTRAAGRARERFVQPQKLFPSGELVERVEQKTFLFSPQTSDVTADARCIARAILQHKTGSFFLYIKEGQKGRKCIFLLSLDTVSTETHRRKNSK